MLQIATAPATASTLEVTLEAIADAFAAGDNPLGEILLGRALDDDLPWDDVCAAAARGVAERFGEGHRG
jgi:hypothetical protein